MNIYSDSEYPIREAIVRAHADTLASYSAPGTWWSGAQRSAIVAEARAARCAAGLQEPSENGEANAVHADLPEAARRVARQVAVSSNDLDRTFFDQALSDGLRDTEYLETVGIVACVSGMDVFARGIGVPPQKLAPPASGEPSRKRPESARAEGAWPETVPGGRRGGQDAIAAYGSNAVEAAPFIYRALSLVPADARALIQLAVAQYLEIENFMNLDFTYEPDISRAQVELLAARVSAINQCFY